LQISVHHGKSPLRFFRRGLYSSCDDVDVPLICPTCQLRDFLIKSPQNLLKRNAGWTSNGVIDDRRQARRYQMYFAAAALVALSGLFYAAGNHEIGSLGVEMCRYGGAFCDNPYIVLVGAGLAAIWGTFVSIR
jgi:hypothetical protein